MAADSPISPWWSAARHADLRPFLRARATITRAVRAWFDDQRFAEVETGILQVSPGNEIHLHAPRTELVGPSGERAARYLRTSPEFACKKLLAAGEERIFEFARVFRDRERGDLHLPEFTMLEWYRTGAAYEVIMADTAVVIAYAARATGYRAGFRSAAGPARSHGRTGTAYRCRGIRAVLPASTCLRPSTTARAIAQRWQQRQSRRLRIVATTPGRIFSARSWSSTSNPIWAGTV